MTSVELSVFEKVTKSYSESLLCLMLIIKVLPIVSSEVIWAIFKVVVLPYLISISDGGFSARTYFVPMIPREQMEK